MFTRFSNVQNKRIFKIIIFLIIIPIFFFNGCTVSVDTQILTRIDKTGSGVRKFILIVNKNSLGWYSSNVEKVISLILRRCPSVLKFESADLYSSNNYKLVFSMYFESIEELKSKSSRLLGYHPEIEYIVKGTPFHQKYIFRDYTDTKDYFKWMTSVLRNNNLISSYDDIYYDVKSYILLYGSNKLIPFNNEVISEIKYQINSFLVTLNISPKYSSATLKINIPKDVDREITESLRGLEYIWGKDLKYYLAEHFQEIPQQNGIGNYTIVISAEDIKDLEEKLRNTIDKNMTIALDEISGTAFKRNYQLTITGNFTSWLGDVKPSNIIINIITPKTKIFSFEVNVTTIRNTSKINETIFFSTYKIPLLENFLFLAIILILLVILILLLVRYRKKKSSTNNIEIKEIKPLQKRHKKLVLVLLVFLIIVGLGLYYWISVQNSLESKIQSNLSDWLYAWQKVKPSLTIKDFIKEGEYNFELNEPYSIKNVNIELLEKLGIYSPDRTKVVDIYSRNSYIDEETGEFVPLGNAEFYFYIIDLRKKTKMTVCLGASGNIDKAIWLNNNVLILAGLSSYNDSIHPFFSIIDFSENKEVTYLGPKIKVELYFNTVRKELWEQEKRRIEKFFKIKEIFDH